MSRRSPSLPSGDLRDGEELGTAATIVVGLGVGSRVSDANGDDIGT
jgi:hypothetical protein